MVDGSPELSAVSKFLTKRFPGAEHVELLKRGGWSSAFGFRVGGRELVARFGQHPQDYEKESVAARWSAANLPVPALYEVGETFGGAYAISERRHGTALDGLTAMRTKAVVVRLFDTLEAIRAIALPGEGYGIWLAPECHAPYASWRGYLLAGKQRDESRLTDWRRRLAAHPGAQAAFDRGHQLLARLVEVCPEVRGVVHNDLLNNLMIDDDDQIVALFDWGNSLAGDPLYDIAWLCVAHEWFPGIERDEVIDLARTRFPTQDLEARVACYELHLALDSLQYLAYAGMEEELERRVRAVKQILDRLT